MVRRCGCVGTWGPHEEAVLTNLLNWFTEMVPRKLITVSNAGGVSKFCVFVHLPWFQNGFQVVTLPLTQLCEAHDALF